MVFTVLERATRRHRNQKHPKRTLHTFGNDRAFQFSWGCHEDVHRALTSFAMLGVLTKYLIEVSQVYPRRRRYAHLSCSTGDGPNFVLGTPHGGSMRFISVFFVVQGGSMGEREGRRCAESSGEGKVDVDIR